MDTFDQSGKSFSEVVLPFKSALSRYWTVAWAPALVICGLVVVVGIRLPNYFLSDSLIYIQPQKVNTKLIENPDKDEKSERLESLVYEILSRPRLRSIIEQFNLYPHMQGVIGKEKALRQLKDAIEIEPVTSQTGHQLLQTFRLSFTHNDPKIAFEVNKALSNLFIEESIISTKSETQGTEEFLDAQLRSARQKLEATEERVQGFVRENFGKLPEHLDAAVARLENAQSQLATNSQLITANTTRLNTLRRELELLEREPAQVVASGGTTTNDPGEALDQLTASLAILRSRYSDEHPDVIKTKRQIEALRSQVSSGSGSRPAGATTVRRGGSQQEARQLRIEMGEVQAQLNQLEVENKQLKQNIGQLERNIQEMPLKEQELVKIKRDYSLVKQNYERLLAAREEAGLQTSLASSQKGTQFKIVEPPSMPVIPSGPNRLLICAAGIIAGLIIFFIIPLGLFFTNSSFKFRDEMESELGVHVLGIVPPMDTPRAALLSRRASSASVVFSLLGFVAGSLAIVMSI